MISFSTSPETVRCPSSGGRWHPRGTLVVVGGEAGGRWTGGLDRVLRAAALSLFVGQKLRGLASVERTEDLEFLTTLLEDGRIRPVIDRTFRLAEAPAAIEYVHEGRARGKVVVTI